MSVWANIPNRNFRHWTEARDAARNYIAEWELFAQRWWTTASRRMKENTKASIGYLTEAVMTLAARDEDTIRQPRKEGNKKPAEQPRTRRRFIPAPKEEWVPRKPLLPPCQTCKGFGHSTDICPNRNRPAIPGNPQCLNCAGMGHYAKWCTTPTRRVQRDMVDGAELRNGTKPNESTSGTKPGNGGA